MKKNDTAACLLACLLPCCRSESVVATGGRVSSVRGLTRVSRDAGHCFAGPHLCVCVFWLLFAMAATTEFVHDEQELLDLLASLEDTLGRELEKNDRAGDRLETAQAAYDAVAEEVERNQADVTLTDISGLEGSKSNRVKMMDLLNSNDLFALRDRLLELKLLDKDLSTNIADAQISSKHWKKECEAAKRILKEKKDAIDEIPAHESNSLVEAQNRSMKTEKQLQELEMALHDADVENKRAASNDKNTVEQLEVDLGYLSKKVSKTKEETRTLDRKLMMMNTQIECLTDSKAQCMEKLRPFIGNQELLRISFNRYDTNRNEELDKHEVFACMQELSKIDDKSPQVTLEEVEKYIADVDKDGSGTIDFQEFTAAFTNLMRGGPAQKK